MKKSILKPLSALFLMMSFMVPVLNAQQTGKHMLWKIEKGGQVQGYMIGSVHLMKPEVYPLDDAFQEVYNNADRVVFELNFDSLKANMLPLVQSMAIYPAGKSIEDALSKETYTRLKNTLDSLQLPVARFNRMEPWLVAMSLPSVMMARAGYTGASGVDIHFFNKAKADGKDIIGLETTEYQLNVFDDLSPELQEKYLKSVLKESGKVVEQIDEIVNAWKHGNAQKIEEILQGEMKQKMPKLYSKLLIERNNNWIPKIKVLLAKDETPLIIVGAGHMVGDKGLVSLLEAEGYSVEQL